MGERRLQGTVVATMGGRAEYRVREHWVQVLMLVASLREFGGRHATDRVLVMVPDDVERRATDIEARVTELGAEIVRFEADEATLAWDPAAKMAAAAAAEEHVRDARELVWVDSDTLVLQDPDVIELGEAADVAYRPVYCANIGSRFSEPLDAFWSLVYEICGADDADAFPMVPCHEEVELRPYINIGFVVVRPRARILRTWKEKCATLLADPRARRFAADDRYEPFLHQAILSTAAARQAGRDRMRELPASVNYSRGAWTEIPEVKRVRRMNDLVTCRYEYPFEVNTWRAGLPAEPPLLEWLDRQRAGLGELLDEDRLRTWREALDKHGVEI